jgi:hypothetical protein
MGVAALVESSERIKLIHTVRGGSDKALSTEQLDGSAFH